MILDPGLVWWMIDTGSRPSVVDRLANIGNTSNLDSNHFGHCTLYKEHFSKTFAFKDLRCNSEPDTSPTDQIKTKINFTKLLSLSET